MIFIDNLKIEKNLYISMQDNGIVTANDENRKPFFVYDLANKKTLFIDKRKTKKANSIFIWLLAFFEGKKEVVYSNGLICKVQNGRFGFYKLETIA